MRQETGLQRAKEETPSIYRQRQNERKKSENRADKGSRGKKEVQKQQEVIKQEEPVWFSGVTPQQTGEIQLRFDVWSNKRQHSHV